MPGIHFRLCLWPFARSSSLPTGEDTDAAIYIRLIRSGFGCRAPSRESESNAKTKTKIIKWIPAFAGMTVVFPHQGAFSTAPTREDRRVGFVGTGRDPSLDTARIGSPMRAGLFRRVHRPLCPQAENSCKTSSLNLRLDTSAPSWRCAREAECARGFPVKLQRKTRASGEQRVRLYSHLAATAHSRNAPP